jgi:hypothetical protein
VADDLPAWAAGRTVAEVWWCGDEECDCTQAQIVQIGPDRVAGFPWVTRRVLWAGQFTSFTYEQTEAEAAAQLAELRQACERLGVPVPERYAAP